MRCAALDMVGYRCRVTWKVRLYTYHGDSESSMHEIASWTVVAFCEEHKPPYEGLNDADYNGSTDRQRRGKNGLYPVKKR